MIRVALETNALYVTKAGVARYIQGLRQGFERVAPADIETFPFAWEVENFGYRQPHRALRTFYRELVWAKFVAPRLLKERNARMLHSTVEPLVTVPHGIKEIVTLHDLAIYRHPERFRRWHRWSGQKRLRRLHRADQVICISQFTADEAVAVLNLPRSRIAVVHNGCDFQPGDRPPERAPDSTIPSEFFLFVGSLEPGKNLALLKEVYRLAEDSKRTLPPLVIVGARWEGVAHEGKPPVNWHYLGRQPDEVLVFLYRRALALVFPSKYEGFGFPVVEAMALGCPVVCSPVASLPEVGGDTAVFTEMTPGAYLDAMERLSRDLRWREELIAAGYSQAKKFSWTRCANETLSVYRAVAG